MVAHATVRTIRYQTRILAGRRFARPSRITDHCPTETARRFRRHTAWLLIVWVALLCLVVSRAPLAEEPAVQPQDTVFSSSHLKLLSIEELLELEVTSLARQPEKLTEAASAIQVITANDIQRSGATTLPEALRLASNLQVAQTNSHNWAITARGFNGAPFPVTSVANKLLVMIDGRSVYTPLFGGVFWEIQHVLMEDIDRIEVVSGPGGTLWGANAVNGVINIVTKDARATEGLYVSGGGGTLHQLFGAIRYGHQIDSNLFFRVYAQHNGFGETRFPNGADAPDSWDMLQGGFRMDWNPSGANTLTIQGDYYDGDIDQILIPPEHTTVDGQNLLGRWTHRFTEASDLALQLYFDRTWRDLHASSFFTEELNTYDIDFQHRFPIGAGRSVIWGAEYRLMNDQLQSRARLMFDRTYRTMDIYSGFVQTEVPLIRDRLKTILGVKLEHNDFSGMEVQPTWRLAWTPSERHTVWGAVSRAVRSPGRLGADISAPLRGNLNIEGENVIAYELGHRFQSPVRFTLSVAGFYNRYDDLRALKAMPARFDNGQRAETWGLEVSGTYQLTERWRLAGGYTFLDEQFESTSADVVPGSDRFEAIDPHNQIILRSSLDLLSNLFLDIGGRYVDALPSSGALPFAMAPAVPDYVVFDVRLAWHLRQWEIGITGRNLGDKQHREFGSTEIPRSISGRVSWRP